jgi:hypothetical protein
MSANKQSLRLEASSLSLAGWDAINVAFGVLPENLNPKF